MQSARNLKTAPYSSFKWALWPINSTPHHQAGRSSGTRKISSCEYSYVPNICQRNVLRLFPFLSQVNDLAHDLWARSRGVCLAHCFKLMKSGSMLSSSVLLPYLTIRSFSRRTLWYNILMMKSISGSILTIERAKQKSSSTFTDERSSLLNLYFELDDIFPTYPLFGP